MGFEVYPEYEDADPNALTGAQAWRMTETENESTIAVGGEGFTTAEHAEAAVANVMLRAQEILHPGTYKRVELTTRRNEMLEYLKSSGQLKRVPA
jgi:hypothetical protein